MIITIALPVQSIDIDIAAHAGFGCIELNPQSRKRAVEIRWQRVPELVPLARGQRRLIGIEPVPTWIADKELGIDQSVLIGDKDVGSACSVAKAGLQEDLEFCMRISQSECVPRVVGKDSKTGLLMIGA